MKPLFVHFGVLAVAGVLAFSVWTKEEDKQKPVAETAVEVWGGTPETIDSVSFESTKRSVKLEPKKDGAGRYYVVNVEKDEPVRSAQPPQGPQDGPPDAGADEDDEPTETKHESQRFVSIKAAEEYVKKIAPLMALRQVGKIEGSREEEFGLDKHEGVLEIKIAGKSHRLTIGGTTPGGQERYARLEENGIIYAVPGDVAQSMLSAESRMLERDFHGYADAEVTRVKISKGGKSREAVKLPEKKDAWADAANPTKLDETIGNYMSKVGKLRVQEYVETPASPIKAADALARVEYFAGPKSLGFLELFKIPGEKTSTYLVRTEYGRWYTKVQTNSGEQVEQDIGGVLK